MAEETLEQIKDFYNYVGSKEKHGYVSDPSALDDRLTLASKGLAQAIQTISARAVLGGMKKDGLLPSDCPPNDEWGLQPGFPSVDICRRRKCFTIFHHNTEPTRILWSGTKPLPKARTKTLTMSAILKVIMSKHTLEELEALRFNKRTETRQVNSYQTIVENAKNATIRNQRLTADVKVWIGDRLPQQDWIVGTLNGTWNHLLEIDHPIMGDFGSLLAGTLVHSVDDHCSSCPAEEWPDGKPLPRWGKLTFLRQETTTVDYAVDPSMLNLLKELDEFNDSTFTVVEKLTQWRRDTLVESQTIVSIAFLSEMDDCLSFSCTGLQGEDLIVQVASTATVQELKACIGGKLKLEAYQVKLLLGTFCLDGSSSLLKSFVNEAVALVSAQGGYVKP